MSLSFTVGSWWGRSDFTHTLTYLMRVTLAVGLLVLVQAASSAGMTTGSASHLDAAPTREPHDPILIVGDTMPLIEGHAGQNGIRRGTGTEADPFVISDWVIQATSVPAIEMRTTDLHFLIENVALARKSEGMTLAVKESPNIHLIDSEISGGPALHVHDAALSVRNTHIQTTSCNDVISKSTLYFTDVEIETQCDGPGALYIYDSEAVMRGVYVHGNSSGGIDVYGGSSFHLEKSHIQVGGPHIAPSRALTLESDTTGWVQNVRVECKQYGPRAGVGVFVGLGKPVGTWSGIKARGCHTGISIDGTSLPLEIHAVEVSDADHGLMCIECNATIRNLSVRNTQSAVNVFDGNVVIHGYMASGVEVDVLTRGESSVHVETQKNELKVAGSNVTTSEGVKIRDVNDFWNIGRLSVIALTLVVLSIGSSVWRRRRRTRR